MLKNVIAKINNFIQWTKKWHFFHALLVPNTFAFIIICLVMFKCGSLLKEYYSSIEVIIVFFTMCYLAEITFIIIALCAQIFFLLFNWTKSHNTSIKNSFLLNNKTYSILYIIAFLYNILCLLSFICFILLSIFADITTF